MMRELIDPVLEKGKRDRDMILKLEQDDGKLVERIDQLETAVYKLKEGGGKTKFDEIAEDILGVEIK